MFLSTSQIFTQKKPFSLKIAKIDNTYHKNIGSLTVRGEIFFENNWLTIW